LVVELNRCAVGGAWASLSPEGISCRPELALDRPAVFSSCAL
jgi:hypothetical protein